MLDALHQRDKKLLGPQKWYTSLLSIKYIDSLSTLNKYELGMAYMIQIIYHGYTLTDNNILSDQHLPDMEV